jgi:predicted transcriptional regulator
MPDQDLIALTADIVSAHVANNKVSTADVPAIVERVYEALAGLGGPAAEEPAEAKLPVVSVRASVKPDYIVCMECGKRQKMLKRHLQTAHGMTPNEYRKDYGLPDTYPMTAPKYSESRRTLAHSIGLGRKRTGSGKTASGDAAPAGKKTASGRRGRKAPGG